MNPGNIRREINGGKMIRFNLPKKVFGGLEPFKEKKDLGKRGVKAEEEQEELTYMQRLALFVPGPVISLWASLKSVVPERDIGFWAIGAIFALIIYFVLGQKNVPMKTRMETIFFSLVAFLLYLYANGDHVYSWVLPKSYEYIAAPLSFFYVFITGLINLKITKPKK